MATRKTQSHNARTLQQSLQPTPTPPIVHQNNATPDPPTPRPPRTADLQRVARVAEK